MFVRRLPSLANLPTAFQDLGDLRHEMDRLFDSLTGFTGTRGAGVFPPINVTDAGEAIQVRAELPGMKPDQLEINVENNTLTIAGTRKILREDDKAAYHRREREWGTFRRSFTLPIRVDSDRVDARYVDGILTVKLPKAAEARPRQITVQAKA